MPARSTAGRKQSRRRSRTMVEWTMGATRMPVRPMPGRPMTPGWTRERMGPSEAMIGPSTARGPRAPGTVRAASRWSRPLASRPCGRPTRGPRATPSRSSWARPSMSPRASRAGCSPSMPSPAPHGGPGHWTTSSRTRARRARCAPASGPRPRWWTEVLYAASPDGSVYALDPVSGQTLRRSVVATVANPPELIQSSPAASTALGRLYVGVAALFTCHHIPGRVMWVDLATGASHSTVLTQDARAGAAVWSSIAVDAPARRVYVTTGDPSGNALADVPLAQSIVALDADSLAVLDHWQNPGPGPNDNSDFGASPTLFTAADGDAAGRLREQGRLALRVPAGAARGRSAVEVPGRRGREGPARGTGQPRRSDVRARPPLCRWRRHAGGRARLRGGPRTSRRAASAGSTPLPGMSSRGCPPWETSWWSSPTRSMAAAVGWSCWMLGPARCSNGSRRRGPPMPRPRSAGDSSSGIRTPGSSRPWPFPHRDGVGSPQPSPQPSPGGRGLARCSALEVVDAAELEDAASARPAPSSTRGRAAGPAGPWRSSVSR